MRVIYTKCAGHLTNCFFFVFFYRLFQEIKTACQNCKNARGNSVWTEVKNMSILVVVIRIFATGIRVIVFQCHVENVSLTSVVLVLKAYQFGDRSRGSKNASMQTERWRIDEIRGTPGSDWNTNQSQKHGGLWRRPALSWYFWNALQEWWSISKKLFSHISCVWKPRRQHRKWSILRKWQRWQLGKTFIG